MQPTISLIFPAYNEARYIATTVSEAVAYFERKGLSYQIIVSADGDDGTREIVAEMSKSNPAIQVIGSVERRGKGYGIRRALALAEGLYIGFSDADNKTPITEFDKFEPFLQQGIDLVIGSRSLPDSKIERQQKWYRRIGSRGFGVFVHTVIGLADIIDTQCGFKFFQQHAARDLFARQQIDGYMYDIEILYLAKRAGYQITQIPIRWRDDGDSRLQLLRGNIRNVVDVLKIRFSGSTKRRVTVTANSIAD